MQRGRQVRDGRVPARGGQHLGLPRGERAGALGERRRGQGRVDDPLAGLHPPDGGGKLGGWRVLEQKPLAPAAIAAAR